MKMVNKAQFDDESRALLRGIGFDPEGLTAGDLAPLRNLFAIARGECGLDADLTVEIHEQMTRATEALIRLSNAVTARAINLEKRQTGKCPVCRVDEGYLHREWCTEK